MKIKDIKINTMYRVLDAPEDGDSYVYVTKITEDMIWSYWEDSSEEILIHMKDPEYVFHYKELHHNFIADLAGSVLISCVVYNSPLWKVLNI